MSALKRMSDGEVHALETMRWSDYLFDVEMSLETQMMTGREEERRVAKAALTILQADRTEATPEGSCKPMHQLRATRRRQLRPRH